MDRLPHRHPLRLSWLFLVLVAMLAAGCVEESTDTNLPDNPGPITPGPNRTFEPIKVMPQKATTLPPTAALRKHDLDDARADALFAGLTVDSLGRVIVLDAASGLYILGAEGTLELLWSSEDLLNRYGLVIDSAFSDVVAVGDNTFALSAVHDGFLLDVENDTLQQHFCYEPGWEEPIVEPGPQLLQYTASLTYDPATTQIIAQPQTIQNQDWQNPTDSWLSTYDRVQGTDLQWFQFEDANYLAGGMALIDSSSILLGSGAAIDLYDIDAGELEHAVDLSEMGITDIQGMAIDRERGTVLVIDGLDHELVELPLSDIVAD